MIQNLEYIYMDPDDLQILQDILKKYPYTIYAFGSRVKGTNQKFSDLDLCVIDDTMSQSTISDLKEDLEDSNLPFTVDVTSWLMMNEDFQKLIEKDLVQIQANPSSAKNK